MPAPRFPPSGRLLLGRDRADDRPGRAERTLGQHGAAREEDRDGRHGGPRGQASTTARPRRQTAGKGFDSWRGAGGRIEGEGAATPRAVFMVDRDDTVKRNLFAAACFPRACGAEGLAGAAGTSSVAPA